MCLRPCAELACGDWCVVEEGPDHHRRGSTWRRFRGLGLCPRVFLRGFASAGAHAFSVLQKLALAPAAGFGLQVCWCLRARKSGKSSAHAGVVLCRGRFCGSPPAWRRVPPPGAVVKAPGLQNDAWKLCQEVRDARRTRRLVRCARSYQGNEPSARQQEVKWLMESVVGVSAVVEVGGRSGGTFLRPSSAFLIRRLRLDGRLRWTLPCQQWPGPRAPLGSLWRGSGMRLE